MFIFRKLADEGKLQEENKIIYNVIIKKKFLNRDFSENNVDEREVSFQLKKEGNLGSKPGEHKDSL